MKTNNNTINNNPLQFTCPICGCHELVHVETYVVHYTIVKVNESGELEYQPKPFHIDYDGNNDDCYFACACYCPGYPDDHGRGDCNFTPHHTEDDPDYPDDPDDRISCGYDMLEWIKDHQ